MPIAELLPLILQGLEAAIAAAPGVVEVVNQSKALINSLFTAKVISTEQQNALHLAVDARAALVAAGIIPVHWTVEPDPS